DPRAGRDLGTRGSVVDRRAVGSASRRAVTRDCDTSSVAPLSRRGRCPLQAVVRLGRRRWVPDRWEEPGGDVPDTGRTRRLRGARRPPVRPLPPCCWLRDSWPDLRFSVRAFPACPNSRALRAYRSHQGRTGMQYATTRGDRRHAPIRTATRKPAWVGPLLTFMVRNAMKKGLPRSHAPRVLERRREAPRNVVRRVGSQS